MTDIFSLTANKLVEKLKEGEISSVEVCTQYIDRIKKFEKDVKAWAHFDKKELLEKAAEADEYRKSGKPLGALHGLPVAIKDIIGTLDMPTECGTVLRKKMTGNIYIRNIANITIPKNGIIPVNISINSTFLD